MKRGDLVYFDRPESFGDGKWTYKTLGPVKVMGVIDGYAMLRYSGCSPFVEAVKRIRLSKEKI